MIVSDDPKSFKEYAAECSDWARTARSARERDIFLQMAQTWLQAAACLELGRQIARNEPHEFQQSLRDEIDLVSERPSRQDCNHG